MKLYLTPISGSLRRSAGRAPRAMNWTSFPSLTSFLSAKMDFEDADGKNIFYSTVLASSSLIVPLLITREVPD